MQRGIIQFSVGTVAAIGLAASGCSKNQNEYVAASLTGDATAESVTEEMVGGTPAETPATPAPFTLAEGEQLMEYRVDKGDTLWELAQRFQTKVSRIQSANSMTGDTIVTGQKIKIPTRLTQMPAAAPAPDPVASKPAAPAAPAPLKPAPAVSPPALSPPPLIQPPAPITPPSPSAPPPVPVPSPAPALTEPEASAPSIEPTFTPILTKPSAETPVPKPSLKMEEPAPAIPPAIAPTPVFSSSNSEISMPSGVETEPGLKIQDN